MAQSMKSHAALKYPHSTLISTLDEHASAQMAADFRLHPSGEEPGRKSPDLEIAITVNGSDSGMVTCKIDGEDQPARPSRGTIWLVPASAQSEEIRVAAPELKVLHLFLPNATFLRLGNEYALPDFPAQAIRYSSVLCDPAIEQIGLSVLSEMMNPSSAGRMLLEGASLFLAARLLQAHAEIDVPARNRPKHGLGAARLKRVLGYIEEHCLDDITVADLADVACLSMFHFIRAFAKAMGTPPHRYISRRRLEAAKDLMAGGRMSLAEIALICQFSSASSFARAFKRAMGITPAEYRRTLR
jgi:AraC family transcriptional regulator